MRYPHYFPGCEGPDFYTSDCAYGCGAWMGSCRSGGPNEELLKKHGMPVPIRGQVDEGAFLDCPCHPDAEDVYLRYPMPHRPVFERQELIRQQEIAKIEAIKGMWI